MLKILLLTGSNSPERAVCLRSGAAVEAALQQSGHAVTAIDTKDSINDDMYTNFDVIFPVIHGLGGEDGGLQAHLESLGYNNFVGSDAASSKLCFDKSQYRALMAEHDIRTPQGTLITASELSNHPLATHPFVLKPFDGGSSVDTFIVRDVNGADFTAMSAALNRYGKMLLEELITGTEITVGVFGDSGLPVIEIIPPADGEFDYENKYNGATQELCPPVNVSEDIQAEAQTLALRIHQLTGCRDFSRTDMMIDDKNQVYVLETNTIPGLTDQSLFPKAAATAGINMVSLCDQLAQFAASRR